MFRQREDGSEVEKDFIKRHMQQLVQALKRVLHLAQTEQQSEQADEALRAAAATALKLDMARLAAVDSGSCAVILGTAVRIRMYAQILAAESELLRIRGREKESTERLHRALRLHKEADRRSPPSEEDVREQAAVRARLGPR